MAQGVPDDAVRMRGEVALVRNWDSPSRGWRLRALERYAEEGGGRCEKTVVGLVTVLATDA